MDRVLGQNTRDAIVSRGKLAPDPRVNAHEELSGITDLPQTPTFSTKCAEKGASYLRLYEHSQLLL